MAESFEAVKEGIHRNVGRGERIGCVVAGAALAGYGAGRSDLAGVGVALLGGALIFRGAAGYCPVYGVLGLSTAEPRPSEPEEEED